VRGRDPSCFPARTSFWYYLSLPVHAFRRSLPNGAPKHRLDQLINRLTKILAETRKLNPDG
jgi:hypothetical protein